MTTKTKNRISIRDAARCVANREAFSNSTGALRGVPGDEANNTTGRMPEDEAHDYLAQKMWGFIDYVVFSYSTPIAWYSNRDGWHFTKAKHSVTTSRHLSTVRYGALSL